MNTLPDLRLLFALCTAVLATAVASQGPTWASPHAVPLAKHSASVVYDEGRGRLVVFGGNDGNGYQLDATWEHDGTSWIRRTPAVSPPVRDNASFAHDPTRGVSMVVGGRWGSASLTDAWQWDGEAWSQVASPPNMAFWATSLLFWHGGTNPGFHHVASMPNSTFTTHRWDGTAWQLVSTNVGTPGPLWGSAVYVPGTGRSYALANLSMGSASMLSWDGTTWQTVTQTGAPAWGWLTFVPGGLVWDEAHSRLITVVLPHQTASATYVGQLVNPGQVDWTAVSNTNPANNVQSPPQVAGERIAYDTRRQRCVLFGCDLGRNDPWTLEWSPTLHWQQQPPNLATSPTDRVYTDMAFDAISGRMVLFGGNDSSGPRNDTWTFDGTAWTNHGSSVFISPRAQPALCYSPSMGTVLFGGGVYPTAYFNDTWFFSGTQWFSMIGAGAPLPRQGHDMVWASGWNCMVMFGGYNGGTLADTWRLTTSGIGVQWTQEHTVGGMPARQSHAMAFDERRNRVVVFGGASASGLFLGDTWELIRATPNWQWVQRVPPQSPPRRWQHRMAYDPARGVVVMTGGYGNPQCGLYCASHLNDVWEYDGETWTQRVPSTTLPAPREGAGFAYDAARQRCVLQGGSGNGVFQDETWYYSAPNAVFGQGMLGGGSLALRCTRFPVAGQPTGFAFDNPLGFGWLTVFLGPAPQVGLTLGPGVVCGTGNFYGVNPIVATVVGSPGSLSFPLPANMGGVGMVLQGIALDPGLCLRLTDPLAVTIHAP